MQQAAGRGCRKGKRTGGGKRKEKEMDKAGIEHVCLSSGLLHCVSRKQYQCDGAEELA